MTSRYSYDFPTRVFLKYKSKMTDNCCVVKFLSLINYLEYIACLYLNTSVTAQVEVKLSGMCDATVDSGAWRDIPTLATLKQGR